MRRITLRTLASIACVVATSSLADDIQKPPEVPLPDAVRLTPVPELSLMIPRGWVACDPALNQQLGGTDLPAQGKQKLCDPSQPPGSVAKLINPDKTNFVFAIFTEVPLVQLRKDLDRAAAQTSDALQRDRSRFCYGVGGPEACEIRPAVFGSHHAIVGKIEKTPQSIDVPYSNKFVVIATSKHAYIVIFAELSTPHDRTNAIVDAIIHSIEAS